MEHILDWTNSKWHIAVYGSFIIISKSSMLQHRKGHAVTCVTSTRVLRAIYRAIRRTCHGTKVAVILRVLGHATAQGSHATA